MQQYFYNFCIDGSTTFWERLPGGDQRPSPPALRQVVPDGPGVGQALRPVAGAPPGPGHRSVEQAESGSGSLYPPRPVPGHRNNVSKKFKKLFLMIASELDPFFGRKNIRVKVDRIWNTGTWPKDPFNFDTNLGSDLKKNYPSRSDLNQHYFCNSKK